MVSERDGPVFLDQTYLHNKFAINVFRHMKENAAPQFTLQREHSKKHREIEGMEKEIMSIITDSLYYQISVFLQSFKVLVFRQCFHSMAKCT